MKHFKEAIFTLVVIAIVIAVCVMRFNAFKYVTDDNNKIGKRYWVYELFLN